MSDTMTTEKHHTAVDSVGENNASGRKHFRRLIGGFKYPIVSVVDKLRPDTHSGSETPDGAPITPEAAYNVLCNDRRRRTVQYLAEDSMTKRELSEALAEDESGSGYDHADRKAAYVSLHQMHLPTLKAAGLVVESGGVIIPTAKLHGLEEIRCTVESRTQGGSE